ncbi:MAG: flavodoxin [Chloroflexi bacterium]|nr:flavodoxin [Chloroflexota bacterium]MYD15630.1 flavodoxin [Chloroflexota bacterium]MYJ01476.1 flavodoxin [Chloroflexota bacterium]
MSGGADESGDVAVMVLYDSQGLVAELATSIVEGAASIDGVEVWDRPLDIADKDELVRCDALILGSPNWTGITGRLKHWWDYTGDLWESGELAGKPAAAFSAGWSPSGGLEATLLQLMHLLIGHGMLIVGLPWTTAMNHSGSYYGATAVRKVTDLDREQARRLGARVSEYALKLSKVPS